MYHSVGTARMSASHTSEKTSHSPGGNESHTSGRAEDHTLGNCDSHIHVSMISEELISRDGSSGEATTSSGELLSSVINGKRSMSTSEKREASILTAEKHHETPTTITTTATATTTTTTPTTTMGTLTTSDTSTRTQEATVSPVTTTPPPDCTDRHGGMWPMESVSEGQTQGEREEGPSPSCSLLFHDAVDLDVPQCSPDVVVLSVQEPQFLPEKIVLLIDRQDAYLRSFSFSNVHQIYDPKLNFGNAFDLITKTLPAFQKNTLFVMLCGTMSALRQVINEKCFLFQCKEPLYNYTLQEFKAPSLDEFLISEAKNLRKNIIEMNNCDVIFTGVLPVRINCAERYEAAKHYTQTGHQVKLACSRHDALYAQLCSGLREFNRWAKTDAASKGFPRWSLVDMLTTSDAVDSSQHFTHPTQADGVTLTGECMVQRRVAIRTRLRETFLRSRKASQSLKLPQATADKEEVKVVAVVPRQCNYKPEAFMQPRETELDEVVLLADQMYRTNLTPLARKRMCLITEVKLSPERIAKVVQRYYSKVPKDKKITWILCLGIYNFVEREHNRVCLTRQCKKKLIGIIDEDSKGSLHQKIHSALSTIKNFKSALEKALPKKATLVVAPPLPSALLGTDTFKGNHTQSHIIAMRYRLCLCSPLTYCFIRRFYMQMFDLWVNTVMKLEGGTCAELMSRYITEYKDKSLRLVDASHSNNYVKRCGKEWNNMMRNVISSTLTSTSFITGLSGLQRSVYLSRLSNVILLESSQNRGQTLTYSLQDKPDKTDYSFKQVVVVGNQMPAELDELCHRLSIHVVPHRVTFDEAGKTLITKYENLWPHNTLWVILTDVLHLIAAKPLPACEAVKCKDPIPVFGIEMPSNENATNLQSYIKVKVDVFISKVKIFFDSLIDKLGEESAVFLPPVTPVFLMRPDLQESHQTLHAMYDSFGKIAMVNGKPKKWRSSYSLLKKAWLEMLEPYLEHYSVPKRILQLYSTSNSNQDWIKTLGELLVHFATTTNIGECDAVFSDAEFSSGEEDMMEVTEAMVATTAAAAAASSSSSSSSVTLASVPTCSFQAMSTPPAQTQAAAGQGMQHEPERTPRQQQQNKGAVMWSGAQKQWHVVKEKEQLPHKTKRDHTTPMIEERQEKKTGEDEDLQGNKKGQKTPRKEKVLPTMEKRQWHDETDKSLQPPRKKICQETPKPEKGQQPPRIEKGQEVCRKKKGKASAKQGKVQEIAKQGRNMKASRGRKHVRASRQKEGQQSSKQGQETSKQRICQETSEPRKNKKEEGQEILIQGKCHVITKTEKDKETPMDGKDRETSTGGNYQVNIKKVHKSPIPIKDQVTIKTEKCPEIRGLEESEQLQMTKKEQVTVKMEEDQSIVKMEQFQDVIKSEEFEDMGRSEEVLWSVRKVEGGGGDRQLSNLEKDAWIILSQTDEDKNIGFPERDHLSNYLEDTAAASGTLAQSQTHIRKTEGSLTEPGNSSTALTWVPKSEELESSHCEDDASDTLARDGLWEDIDASVLERNMEESCCKQDVDESGPKEDLEESGSKQNIEQRIPRKDLDGSELTEKRLKEDLNESGPKQNTEQHGPNYDVRESNTKQDTENSDLKPSVEQSIPKQDIEQTSPKQSTEESYPKEHDEKQRHKTNMDENVPRQGDHLSDFEVASNPDSIETVPLDVDSGEQEYIFNLSDDSDIFECEPEGGAGGEDQITKEVVVGTPLRGSKTEGDVEVTCLPNRKRKLSSSGQDSPAPSCSSYNSSFDSDQEMKKLFLMLEESINQTYQVNLQTFMQVPEVHPDYEAKHAEFLKSYKKQHEGKEHDEEHHERSWGEFWEDTVGKQLHEDWEKSKKELVEQFRVIESNSKNSSSSNSTREDKPKQMKRDESDKENQKFQSYSSNPQPLLSVCHKKSESSPLSVNRSPKTNPKHSSDFESCETDMMQFKQLLSEINPGTMSSELKRQALQLDMDKVMTSDTKKRVHLILSSFALLSELGRSLDSLAPAVVPIIKAVLDKEVDSEEALNILAKKDNVEVLKKCTEKLMLLSEKARGAYKNKLLRCVKDTIELLENVTTSLKTIKVVWGLDIPSIAKATAHQDMTHVLQFIRNTLASKGVHNPSRSMLNELFLSVSSQHFNLAIQTQPPTSPDPSK